MKNMIKIFCVKVLVRLGLERWANTTISLQSGYEKVRIPIMKGIGLQHVYQREEWMDILMEKIPYQKGVFIDIGANIGQSLRKYKLFHPDGKYLGFEPNETCVLYLRTFIQKNLWENTVIVPKALCSKVGVNKLTFYGKQSTDASATIIEDFRPANKIWDEKTIETTHWEGIEDSLKLQVCDCIKIDVEGSELEVLQTLKHKIKTDLPYIIIEILPVYSEINISRLQRQDALETLVKELDYCLFRIKTTNEVGISLLPIENIGIHKEMGDTNYIMVHQSRVKELHRLFPIF